jgi:hypothetical protein
LNGLLYKADQPDVETEMPRAIFAL